jgi:hypothetical protein
MGISEFFKSEKPCIFAEDTGTTVILGVVTAESESGSIRVTDNAVEDGTIITDHESKDPESVEVKTFLSDSNDLLGSAVSSAKTSQGLTVDTMTVKDKIEYLKAWRDEGYLVTYCGPVFSSRFSDGYDIIASSMLITKVDISRSSDSGSGIDVSISLRKITIAEAMVKNAKLPTAAKSRTKKGNSTTKTETTTAKSKSILKGIFG